MIPIKIYLTSEGSSNWDIRKCKVPYNFNFMELQEVIYKTFPNLFDKEYTIYWKDSEGDTITLTSDDDLNIMREEGKDNIKFYVNTKEKLYSDNLKKDNTTNSAHPMVCCQECDGKIVGFRYKCIMCKNYNLCSSCEKKFVHSEHIMLRIPNSQMLGGIDIDKVVNDWLAYTKHEMSKHGKHHRGRHSHDRDDFGKKKRKCDKYESGHDSDEPEEILHKKHCHGKKKKNYCMYSHLLNEFFNYWDPSQFLVGDTTMTDGKEGQKSNERKTEEDSPHVKYLKSIGKTITSLMDPLGIDVDFEVRTNDNKQEPQKDAPASTSFKKDSPAPTPSTSNEKETSASTSTFPQKEVRFDTSNKNNENMAQKVEEISKILAKQKVNDSPERDDWVSFEELKQDLSDNCFDNSKESAPKPSQTQDNATQATAPPSETTQVLYPTLSAASVVEDPVIRDALEKMLSMGFKNDGDVLTNLLKAKKGDINQVLELL